MKLLVDYRERSVLKLVEDICEDVVVTQLSVGDYLLISGSEGIVVERKTINDLLTSIRSNRLWDQLLRMMKTEKVAGYSLKRRILLIHGNYKKYFENLDYETDDLKTSWSQLMGAYMEILYVYNTPIIHVESDIAFKAFMKILIKRESAGKNDKLPSAKWYMKPAKADLPLKNRKKYILSALPYIGNLLASNLLDHFSTISDIACAQVEDLKKVPKIGKKRAELIYKMFH
ncbi:ERCC4-type nuclease [Candidatus Bathyarchaeota archaeon]|nr:MAG: ERCC4-type nuclease [Candidatus Bathyarchaeota archaeon]